MWKQSGLRCNAKRLCSVVRSRSERFVLVLVAQASRLCFRKAVRPAVPAAFCRPAGLPQAAVTAWRPAGSQKRAAAH